MRAIAIALAGLVVAATASAQSGVVVQPRPAFPAPASEVTASGARLGLVSSRYHSPADPTRVGGDPPHPTPQLFRDADFQLAVHQRPPRRIFLLYGGRYLVSIRPYYAVDFVNFARPPNGPWAEDLTWARQGKANPLRRTYAPDLRFGDERPQCVHHRDRCRGTQDPLAQPALVANAQTFVVSGDLIVSGYGFTAEPDFLYLLDRRTGKVLDRLAVPSAPEVIRLRGERLFVRTYDRDVVARIVR